MGNFILYNQCGARIAHWSEFTMFWMYDRGQGTQPIRNQMVHIACSPDLMVNGLAGVVPTGAELGFECSGVGGGGFKMTTIIHDEIHTQ